MRKGQRRSSVLVTHTDVPPDQQGTHEVQRHISHQANALGHFHIAASINPNTGEIQPLLDCNNVFAQYEKNKGSRDAHSLLCLINLTCRKSVIWHIVFKNEGEFILNTFSTFISKLNSSLQIRRQKKLKFPV